MKTRTISMIGSALVLAGATGLFMKSASADEQAGPVLYQQEYGVSREAAVQLARIERLGERGLWADASGPWIRAYRLFPAYSHDWTTILVFAADQTLTFWSEGSGPSIAQKAELERLVLDMLGDPTPTDEQLWSAITLAGKLGIASRSDIALMIESHAKDDATRDWVRRVAGWGR